MSHTRFIPNGSIDIATEAFGASDQKPVVLIMGAMASMLGWPDAFCEDLARRGHYVIRFDHRDTGRSTTGEPGAINYTTDDLAADVEAILNGYGFTKTHLIGMSLGGMIAQLVALQRPGRVASLTAISSCAFDEDDADLPAIDPAFLAHLEQASSLDWSDRKEVVAFQLETYRICAGQTAPFDESRARRLVEREYDRAINPQSALNHGGLTGGDAVKGTPRAIKVLSLVIHGRDDRIVSLAHARKLATALKYARLVVLEAAGHEINERDWPKIISEVSMLASHA